MIDDMPDIFVSTKQNESLYKSEDKPEEKPSTYLHDLNSEKKHKIKLLTSYCIRPEIFFSNLNDNEEILLFLRRHFITNVPWIVQGALLMLLPVLIGIFLTALGLRTSQIPASLSFFSLLFYYLLVFEFFFLNFVNWFYNISLVTNQRVIDIDFRVLFSKHIAATKIVQIEDVSLSEVGLIRSIFDYGDVRIQTAGTAERFEFLAVPHPEDVVHIIGDLIGGKHV